MKACDLRNLTIEAQYDKDVESLYNSIMSDMINSAKLGRFKHLAKISQYDSLFQRRLLRLFKNDGYDVTILDTDCRNNEYQTLSISWLTVEE